MKHVVVFLFILFSGFCFSANKNEQYLDIFDYSSEQTQSCQIKKELIKTLFKVKAGNFDANKIPSFKDVFGDEKVNEILEYKGDPVQYQKLFFKNCLNEVREEFIERLPK